MGTLNMKFNFASTAIFISTFGYGNGQQPGSLEQEEKPTITLKECTIAGGCSSKQAKLTLDANWRWIHEKSGYENCYTGNEWNPELCTDPIQCGQNCVRRENAKNKIFFWLGYYF